jgi:hypothetical protein
MLIYSIKLPSGHVYKKYMKQRWISHLDLGPISKTSLYVYTNIPKFEKKSEIWNTPGPSILDKGHPAHSAKSTHSPALVCLT